MIDTTRTQRVLRTNQAAVPPASFARPRLFTTHGGRLESPGRDSAGTSSNVRLGGHANLLARVARAARVAVQEVRQSGDVPLPHLYRGRDFGRRRDAA